MADVRIHELAPGDEPLLESLAFDAAEFEADGGMVYTGQRNAAAIAFYRSLGWQAEEEADLVFTFDPAP